MSHLSRKKIAFLYSSNGYGGMLRNLELILTHINLEKFEPYVFLLSSKDDVDNELSLDEKRKIELIKIPDERPLDFSALRQLADLLKEHSIDVLSCHGYKADFYGRVVRFFYGSKQSLFSIAHGWIDSTLKLKAYCKIDKYVLRSFDRVVLVSEAQRAELSWSSPILTVVNNAVDPKLFSVAGTSEEARIRFAVEPDDFVFVSTARLSEEKQHSLTVAAFADLQSRTSKSLKLLIAGEGKERARLEAQIKALGLGDRVSLLGYQKEVAHVYMAADALISASRIEGMPNNILEAQALGIPVIASDIPASRLLIADQKTGLLFAWTEMSRLSDVMQEILENSSLRTKLVRAARDNISSKFSMKARMRMLEHLYEIL